MRDSRTDEQIEQEVIAMAVSIWDKRDVFASKFLCHTYCTSCEQHKQLKTWCLPCLATLESLCARCWIKSRVAEMIEMRDKHNKEYLDMQMSQEQQREYCNRVMRSNEPPKEWRQPKLDVADFARL